MNLSIVVPAHNEQENIADVIEKIEHNIEIPFELIVVNDHSIDNTERIIKELSYKYHNIKLIENKLQKGFANAVKAGFNSMAGDMVIPIMADLCDDLSTVKIMFDKINSGYDVVCGCRYMKGGGRTGGSKLKGFLSYSAGWSLRYLLGIPTHDIANAFKMYRRQVIESIAIDSSGFEMSMEIPLKAYYLGFKIGEVPTVWKEREKGKSSFKMLKLLPSYIKLYFWAIFQRIAR